MKVVIMDGFGYRDEYELKDIPVVPRIGDRIHWRFYEPNVLIVEQVNWNTTLGVIYVDVG